MSHINHIIADWGVLCGNRLAEKHTQNPTSGGVGHVLKNTIDRMDQAKSRVPRRMAPTMILKSVGGPSSVW